MADLQEAGERRDGRRFAEDVLKGALSGHIALFFTLQDDRITHLIHYDCIAP